MSNLEDRGRGSALLVVFLVLVSVVAAGAAVGADERSDGNGSAASTEPRGGSGDERGSGPLEAAQETVQEGTLTGETNLSDASTKFVGAGPSDAAGRTVSAAGDVNDDGIGDLLVAAPRNGTGGDNAGAVYLFYGPVESGDVNVSEANVTLVGAPNDLAGTSVASGDVDADGHDDIIVGAPYNGTNGPWAGAVYVVSGQELSNRSDTSDGPVNLTDADEVDSILYGASAVDNAGFSLATVPDPRGGAAVVVGAPLNDSDGRLDAGATYVVRNPTEKDGEDLPEAANTLVTGVASGDRLGYSVADAEDFDADGNPEIVVGAPRNDTAGDSSGAAYVLDPFFGGRVEASEGLTLAGVHERDEAGFSVATAGDVNNDSAADVVVGAPFNDSNGNESGAAYVLFGGEGALEGRRLVTDNVTLRGAGPDDVAGYSVAAAGSGDVTCDGYDDVLVGAPQNDTTALDAGAAYLVTGGADLEETQNLSTAAGRFYGEGPGDRAGAAVAGVNDTTGDGREDLLVGAPRNDTGGDDAGAAYLLRGTCLEGRPPTATPTPTPTPTPEPEEPKPEKVDVDQRCSPDGGVIEVENDNEQAVRVVVEGPNGYTESVTLDPGEDAEFEGLADGDYRVETFADGERVGKTRLEVSCPTEQVDVDRRCDDGVGEMDIVNPNEESVRVRVTGPNGYERTVTLDGGGAITIGGLANGQYDVRTTSGLRGNDYRIGSERVTIDCEPVTPEPVDPDAIDLTAVCTDAQDGLAKFRITNDNDQAVELEYAVDGETDGGTVRVPADGKRFIVVDVGDDAEGTVRLFFEGEEVESAANASEECDLGEPNETPTPTPEPVDEDAIRLDAVCTDARDGLAQFRVRNGNDEPVTVEYDVFEETGGRTITVPANGERTIVVDIGDDAEGIARLFYQGKLIETEPNGVASCDLGEPNPSPTKSPTPTQSPPPATPTQSPTPTPEDLNIPATVECENLTITNTLDRTLNVFVFSATLDEAFLLEPGESRTFTEPGGYELLATVDTNGNPDLGPDGQDVSINGDDPSSIFQVPECPTPTPTASPTPTQSPPPATPTQSPSPAPPTQSPTPTQSPPPATPTQSPTPTPTQSPPPATPTQSPSPAPPTETQPPATPTRTAPPPTDTPDRRNAISFVALCTEEDPSGATTTVQATAFKDGDTSEPVNASYASDVRLSAVAYKAGPDIYVIDDLSDEAFVGEFTVGDGTVNAEVTSNAPCPAGQSLVAKYEWTGNTFEEEEMESEGNDVGPSPIDLSEFGVAGLSAPFLLAAGALVYRRRG